MTDKWWKELDEAPEKVSEFPYRESYPDLNLHVTGKADCILDNFLYLGDLESSSVENMKSLGITHVISLVSTQMLPHIPMTLPKGNHLIFCVSDHPTQSLVTVFPKSITFIKQCRERINAKVLVHCAAGISRSSTIVIAYLMKTLDMTLEQAYIFVQSKRPVICPNIGFMKQLKKI